MYIDRDRERNGVGSLRTCLLASGSRGNSLYLESGSTRVLVDAGLSAREIEARLTQIEVDPSTLTAILLTHEHGDHARGVGPLCRRYKTPLYIHPDTLGACTTLGKIDTLIPFEPGRPFAVNEIEVTPFPTTHDAVAPVGFVFDTPEGRIGVATDLGKVTRLIAERLKGCRVLVLEMNHDEQMLRDGSYPWSLKNRIRSAHGHLSNTDALQLLREVVWEGLEMLYLAHLSEENNAPEQVDLLARELIAEVEGCEPVICVAGQDLPSHCFQASPASAAMRVCSA